MNNYKGVLPGLFVLLAAGVLYRKYQDKMNGYESEENEKLIKKYLLNENIPGYLKKPILWIHIPYKINARIWKDYGSRNTENLNEPYLYLTIKSIINNCSNSFRICLIDDNSFHNLLPSFNINFSKIPEPIDENIRTLSKLMLLKTYGGMFVPPSFICTKNLKNLYNDGIKDKKMFFNETLSRNSTSDILTTFTGYDFMGCDKKCPIIDECITYLQSLISRDATSESKFDGNFQRFIFSLQKQEKINIITGEKIGIKDSNGDAILIDDIMNDTPIEMSKNNYGLLIPHDELLIRMKYKYFVHLSIPEILESETFIGKFLRDENVEINHSATQNH
tara:strand:+ start:7192 stop:8193 length:1002 start_codon:yes stop_codon:yes gene_type:complete